MTRETRRGAFRPWAAAALTLAATAVALRGMGRLWWCACGRAHVWVSDAWSPDTSQHLLDPYSFTHVLHGFLFCWLLMLVAPRLPAAWQMCAAVAAESLWELVENTDMVIGRYREATAALGYEGDTVVNSVGDILACGLGFAAARRLGLRWSLAAFALVEAALLLWIRDSLLLNVLMLVYPSEAVRAWQAGG